jgi:hypothetical protein
MKKINTVVLGYALVDCTSPLWNLNVYLFLVYINNILRSTFERTDTDFKSELKMIGILFTRFYTKALHGAAITVWYFTFVKKTDPKYIWKMNPRGHILEPLYLFFSSLYIFTSEIAYLVYVDKSWTRKESPKSCSYCKKKGTFFQNVLKRND